MSLLNYNNGDEIEFKIDYENESVKFLNGTINDKTSMFLKEFAITVLGIEPETKEFVAAFIGKEVSSGYNKFHRYYIIKQVRAKKNHFEGTIQKYKPE